jgi:hypothetical protein
MEGETTIGPVPFVQSIDDFIESYHSRSGFSRARMGAETAAAFDEEARKFMLEVYGGPMLSLQITAHIVWGIPLAVRR